MQDKRSELYRICLQEVIMAKIRCILIDPSKQKVEEIFLDSENMLQEWYKTIGNNCNLVTNVVYMHWMNIANGLLADEEILNRQEDIEGMFELLVGNQVFVIVNKAIIVGNNQADGSCVDCTFPVSYIENQISWRTKEDALIYAKQVTTPNSDVIWWQDNL